MKSQARLASVPLTLAILNSAFTFSKLTLCTDIQIITQPHRNVSSDSSVSLNCLMLRISAIAGIPVRMNSRGYYGLDVVVCPQTS